jgi:hypothetical protein
MAGNVNVDERRLVADDGSVGGMHQVSRDELAGIIRTWIPESISTVVRPVFTQFHLNQIHD